MQERIATTGAGYIRRSRLDDNDKQIVIDFLDKNRFVNKLNASQSVINNIETLRAIKYGKLEEISINDAQEILIVKGA